MESETRKLIWQTMEEYSDMLSLGNVKILDIGTAGDKEKPSDRAKFFKGNEFKTMDFDERWQADYICDITNTSFPDNYWDLVICGQVLEHTWEWQRALKEICRITKKWAIIDTPFYYPEHPEPPSFADYFRFTSQGMKRGLEEAGFQKVEVRNIDNLLVTALAEKI